MNNSKLLGLFSVIAIFGSVACSTPVAPTSSTDSKDGAVKVANSHSYRLTASSDTKASLGVSTWHVLTQGDTQTIVLEGVDASGNVKFATSFREEGDMVRIDSYKVASGKLTLKKDGAGFKLASNTIAAEKWDKFAAAYAADADAGKIVQEYAFRGKLSGLKKLGGLVSKGISKISDAYNAYQAGKSIWDAVTGKDDAKDSKTDNKSSANDTANDKDQQTADNKDDQSADNKDDQSADNKDDQNADNTDDQSADNKDDQNTDNTDDQTADNQTADNSDQTGNENGEASDEGDVSANEGDQNLDESAGEETGGEEAGGEEGGGEESGSEGGGEEGGGEEFALHNTCKHLSYGKTSKVYICTKY